jgi:hypothetical protein
MPQHSQVRCVSCFSFIFRWIRFSSYHFSFVLLIEWYRGYIVSANADTGGWDIEYEDGEYDLGLCRQCVRPYVPYKVGEMTEVRDGAVYVRGHVTAVYPNETYDIQSEMRRFPEPSVIEVGAPILGWYRGEEWYPGIVLRVNNDGTFDIQYEDGEFEASVPSNYIQLPFE